MQSNSLARIHSVRQVTKMYSVYMRQRILHYERMGHKAWTICRLLREESMRVSHVGVHKFLQKNKETRTRLGPTDEDDGSSEVLVEQQMRDDYEMTAVQLHALLASNGCRITLILVLIVLFTNRSPDYCAIPSFCSIQWKRTLRIYFQCSVKTKR